MVEELFGRVSIGGVLLQTALEEVSKQIWIIRRLSEAKIGLDNPDLVVKLLFLEIIERETAARGKEVNEYAQGPYVYLCVVVLRLPYLWSHVERCTKSFTSLLAVFKHC